MSEITPAMNLVFNVTSLHARMLKRIDQGLSVHGISFTEFMVMHYLNNASNGTMRRIDLADSISLSASGVTRLLMPMQKIGLIQKEVNPRDARVSLVKLTKTGKKIYADSAVSFEYAAGVMTQKLSATQLVEFIKLTDVLL
ncbi:MAG: MarR family transcriptional regulator [Oceanicoccus sp.]